MRAFWILFLYERGMEIPHPNIYDDYIRNSKYGTKSKKKKKKVLNSIHFSAMSTFFIEK